MPINNHLQRSVDVSRPHLPDIVEKVVVVVVVTDFELSLDPNQCLRKFGKTLFEILA